MRREDRGGDRGLPPAPSPPKIDVPLLLLLLKTPIAAAKSAKQPEAVEFMPSRGAGLYAESQPWGDQIQWATTGYTRPVMRML